MLIAHLRKGKFKTCLDLFSLSLIILRQAIPRFDIGANAALFATINVQQE